ncbi:HK97-gp10 family putative phage morphogenesis protein [Cytobacillus purgationiresistens]|uniref:HK97 gp10 family phage protein n=1 Tax=Cytobacillus purgationiresistens TaxID=863449 RepID=A0ABU0AC97_9BACI|nr:HK97-gp10 family putative phage morphogenesis protein [Cytobacillus purgationiresistens]MDQ0268876.1 HK97 gp10 family phage protein [Cytobacillus purgationiresistens]
MANSSFQFDGINEHIEFFDSIGRDIDKVDDQALKAGGEEIAKRQRSLVNRSKKNQAHIENNITVTKAKESDEGKFVNVGPNQKVAWRAKFLEYGTSKMPAYPFIDKGAEQGENDAISAMEQVYMRALSQ